MQELKMDFDKYKRNRVKREPIITIQAVDTQHLRIVSNQEVTSAITQSPQLAEKFNSDDNISSIDHEDITAYLKLKTDGFHIVSNGSETLVSDLKNLIASIGKIHEISVHAAHFEIILTLIQSWEMFDKVNSIVSNPQKKVQYRFELVGIFFKAAQMPMYH